MKRLYIAIGLSLAFHFAQVGLISLTPNVDLLTHKSTTDIEVIEESNNNTPHFEKKIVPVPKVASIINEDPARFFAENTQRVEHETATRNLGQTRNQTKAQKKMATNASLSDEPEFAKSIRQTSEVSAPSALEFQLPSDIAEGSATNLNTDAHIYASFYNRVTELFYIRWVQRLDVLWERMPTETKQNLSGRVWLTDIEVLLKASGEYERSFIMKPSGFQNFDNAAVYAFQNAKFFPNPPKAKVEPDGFIRLRYRIGIHVR